MQQGRCLLYRQPETLRAGRVLVVTAGTADRPVADECLLTLTAHGFAPDRLDDVGVAGLHRLLAHVDAITAADAVVVLAGMEGALASVVGGLTGAPVVAVPTSVGYGASLEGVTALLAMHASCAAGVTVVGIDNGYGAACAVARMLNDDRSLRSPATQAVVGRSLAGAPSLASAESRPMSTAYVNCSAGVAGDMLLGALVDAGADPDEIAATVAGLGVDGYAIAFERVQRGGIAATFANVVTDDHGHEHRPVSAIEKLLDAADLPERVRTDAQRVFAVLAEAEGAVHGIDPADVELHEVGALDAIVDVVGTVAALHVPRRRAHRVVADRRRPRRRAGEPRRPAEPATGRRPPARQPLGARRRRRDDDGAVDADGRRRARRPRRRLRRAAGDERRAGRLRRRARRPGRAAERRAGACSARRLLRARRRDRDAPPCSSRSTSTTSPARCSPTRSARRSPPAPTTRGRRRS